MEPCVSPGVIGRAAGSGTGVMTNGSPVGRGGEGQSVRSDGGELRGVHSAGGGANAPLRRPGRAGSGRTPQPAALTAR